MQILEARVRALVLHARTLPGCKRSTQSSVAINLWLHVCVHCTHWYINKIKIETCKQEKKKPRAANVFGHSIELCKKTMFAWKISAVKFQNQRYLIIHLHVQSVYMHKIHVHWMYGFVHVTYPGSGRLKWVNVRYGEEVGQVTTVTTTPTCMYRYTCMCMT